MTGNSDLWSESRSMRLAAAKGLRGSELANLHQTLCGDRSEAGWPYGCPTSINPFLLLLGPSPGASPMAGDEDYVTRPPYELPTAGVAHPGVWYRDGTGYWNKVRHLARTFVDADGTLGDDALALFGTMNLSTKASGSASDVDIETDFGKWVLETIRDGLRPRVLVLMGLRGKFRRHRRFFESAFANLDVRQPHREYRFAEYERKNLSFKEWDLVTPEGFAMLLVDWPQHPVKAPFTGVETDWWGLACEQFSDLHRNLLG